MHKNLLKFLVIIFVMLSLILITEVNIMQAEEQLIDKNNDFWEKILNQQEYNILVDKGTERAFNNEYYDKKEKGVYTCAACNNLVFDSEDKFESGSGWPSFSDVISKGAVETRTDTSLARERTEVICGQCGGHLGHVFEDGPEPTGLRYCMNSGALNFLKEIHLGMGCFWGPDALFGSIEGVYFTKVGYAGGEKDNPTYNDLGNHTETIKIMYDPEKISMEELLQIFAEHHNLNSESHSPQYKSVIFYQDSQQKETAEKFLQEKRQASEKEIYTEIQSLDKFYQAEDYHQKYKFRNDRSLVDPVLNIFEAGTDITDYRIFTRLNAYSAGYLSKEEIKNEFENSWIYIKAPQKIENIIDSL